MSPTRIVTLFQMNDLHAQPLPHAELFWQAGRPTYRRDIGGVARIAGVVKQAKRERPGEVLFFDCGDALFGSYYPMQDSGAGMVRMLNTMGIDATNGGHWEFAFGPAEYRKRMAELRYPAYACNVYDLATGELILPPYGIHEARGVRIGVIGLASNIVDKGMPPSFSKGLRFTMGLEDGALQHSVEALRGRVDLIVALSHLGLAQDIEVAKRIGGIDVFISGHTHNRLWRPYVLDHPGGRTLFVQSGFSGSFLGRLDLTVETGSVYRGSGAHHGSGGGAREVAHTGGAAAVRSTGSAITDYRWQLLTVDASCPEDDETRAAVEAVTGPHRHYLEEVVGHTATSLHRMLFLENTMDNFITQAYREYTGTQVAISHGWRYGPPVPAGEGGPHGGSASVPPGTPVPAPVTRGDLWNMVPLNVPVFTLEMTGQELREQVERWMASSATAPIDQKGGYFTRQAGMNVLARINNPDGFRTEELFIDGAPYQPDRLYTVTVGGVQDVKGAGRNQRNLGVRALDILEDYLRRKSPVTAELTHDKFVWI